MSKLVWEMLKEEMNELSDVSEQLMLFADMSDHAKEISLNGARLGRFLSRLAGDLTSVTTLADERRKRKHPCRITPDMLARIIATVSGQQPVSGNELNGITHQLQTMAEADTDMRQAAEAWERVIKSGFQYIKREAA